MEDITLLYQGAIRDHWRNPRNYGLSSQADLRIKGDSLMCGDHITLAFCMNGDRISDVRFEAEACAVCLASTSMMTLAIMGKGKLEAKSLAQAFVEMMTNDRCFLNKNFDHELALFEFIRQIPSRSECAILPWRTLETMFANQE